MAEPPSPRNNRTMRIEKLSARESGRALPLVQAQYREHRIRVPTDALSRALRGLPPRRGALFVATDRRADIGVAAISFTWTLERGGKVAWLDELYVVPERRGGGVGRKLLRRAAKEARAAMCRTMELEVVRGHERAAKLYLREGFSDLRRRRYSRTL
jgi:GNAT superfamily N-acetyltransferase